MTQTPIDARDTANPRPEPAGRFRRGPGALLNDDRWISVLRRCLSIVFLLIVWQVVASLDLIESRSLPQPLQVWNEFVRLLGNGSLPQALLVSIYRVIVGSAIGIALGILLGIVAGISRIGEDIVDTPLQMYKTVPFLGMLPLLMIWLGIGEPLKVGIVVLAVLFPVYLSVFKGIRGIDVRFRELASISGVTGSRLIFRVIFPGALPSFLVGLRFALAMACLSLVVGETVNADQGIGFLIMRARDFMRMDTIIVGLVAYSAIGLLGDLGVRWLEAKLTPWQREFVG